MSNVSYDLDSSGGLMPLIRALIKPPDEDSNVQKNKKHHQHPYYKRPGKGHNHDSCDACGEGGDLICCDRCPASFHLGCYDPPLDENDIPAGQWLCKHCKGLEAEKPSSSHSSRAQSPDDVKDSDKKIRSLRNRIVQVPKKKLSKDESDEVKIKDEEGYKSDMDVDKPIDNKTTKETDDEQKDDIPEEEKIKDGKEEEKTNEDSLSIATEDQENLDNEEPDLKNPLELLIKAARIMNPKQFELPREMRIPCPFPGTDKETNGKNGNSSVITVDSSGCVPLPAKICFVCTGTCKQAPLLQCDYCPLLFHQDCLDPPLTALPTGRWMCPNHVEQYIDWKLVSSISATERVALWERFSGPVDQQQVKMDFLRLAHNPQPAFRVKVPVDSRSRVVVPEMVRRHYSSPPPLLPSRREYIRCRNVLRNLKMSGTYDESDEERDKPPRKICLNVRCGQNTRDGKCPLEETQSPEADQDLLLINKQRSQSETDSTSEISDTEIENLTTPAKRTKSSHHGRSPPKRARSDRLHLKMDREAEDLLDIVDDQLKRLDSRLVKLLAWQRLQQVLVGEQCFGPWRRCPLSNHAEELIYRSIDRSKLARFGVRQASLPSQLLSRPDRERIAQQVWGPPPTLITSPLSPGHSLSAATLKATICSLIRHPGSSTNESLGRPVPMRLSRLTVGSDSGSDLPLDPSKCRYLSTHHATIFYDEVSGHFELMNYSEWGSVVNGVLYTCDMGNVGVGHDKQRGDHGIRALDRLHDKHTNKRRIPMLATPFPIDCSCLSPLSARSRGAWEGSALVQHGALLQFGCLLFVFCIPNENAPDNDAKYEHVSNLLQ